MQELSASGVRGAVLWLLVGLSACSSLPKSEAVGEPEERSASVRDAVSVRSDEEANEPRRSPATAGETSEQADRRRAGSAEIYRGSGTFLNTRAAAPKAFEQTSEGDVTLNFQDADIRELVKSILGDILNLNYTIDNQIQGKLSIQTSRPVPRGALLSTLEKVLRMNGAVLVADESLYRVVPMSSALLDTPVPRLRLGERPGFQTVVVPLRYIGAKEMQKILEPIVQEKAVLTVDPRRNLMVLAGTRPELRNLLETIEIFDVDQLKGMSVGLFTLVSAKPETVRDELLQILGDGSDSGVGDMVQLVPLERLNALLAITPQPRYLDEIRRWIERLDRTAYAGMRNLYVYHVENGKAGHLAGLLSQLFDSKRSQATPPASGSGPKSPSPIKAAVGGEGKGGVPSRTGPGPVRANGADLDASLDVGEVTIIADEENNSLLIMATAGDYEKVEHAVRRLDVVPMQVLVEATIIEVTLTDRLSYGLQWFFKHDIGSRTARGAIDLPLDLGAGLRYEIFSGGTVRATLETLKSQEKINVISSPSLMVLDNRTASIRVGDQVPVRTSETTNTATSGDAALVTSTIQFRDTGVLLEVTPRVNAGGMITVEISQEVNDVDRTTTSNIDSPTINQRQIRTSVAVHSGETIVLGGLIRDNRGRSRSGVPLLQDMPGLGWLFKNHDQNEDRTELLVLITPTAVAGVGDARRVTRELKSKMKGLMVPLQHFEDQGKANP